MSSHDDTPAAIEGTWSDIESAARYVYFDEGVPQTTLYELAEAVLVLLAEIQQLREVADAARDIPLLNVESDPYRYRLAVALDALAAAVEE